MMVAFHATIIGYVRSQVSRLKDVRTTSVAFGDFRFRTAEDPENIYFFQLHGLLDPNITFRDLELLDQVRLEIRESVQMTLTQAEIGWLNPADQNSLKARLLGVITKHTKKPLVSRLVITDWLVAPTNSIVVQAQGKETPLPQVAPVLR